MKIKFINLYPPVEKIPGTSLEVGIEGKKSTRLRQHILTSPRYWTHHARYVIITREWTRKTRVSTAKTAAAAACEQSARWDYIAHNVWTSYDSMVTRARDPKLLLRSRSRLHLWRRRRFAESMSRGTPVRAVHRPTRTVCVTFIHTACTEGSVEGNTILYIDSIGNMQITRKKHNN